MTSKDRIRGITFLLALSVAGCGASSHASQGSHRHRSTHKIASNSRHAGAAATGHATKLMVLGFWDQYKAAPVSTLSASNHTLSTLSPLWYSVTASGSVTSQVNKPLLTEAKKLHTSITPLFNDGTGKQAFLTSKATRTAAVQNIDHIVAANSYQGVNIDFEPPVTSLKSDLTAFMVQLRDTLPRTDSITIDIVPNSGGAYDYAQLAPEVNHFILMSYDEHSSGTPEGPVAALDWVASPAHGEDRSGPVRGRPRRRIRDGATPRRPLP